MDLRRAGRKGRRRIDLTAQRVPGSRERWNPLDDEIGEIHLTLQRQTLCPIQARRHIGGREQELSRNVIRRADARVQHAPK